MKVVVHADIEEIVSLVSSRSVSGLIRPSESVTVDGTLRAVGLVIVVIKREEKSVLVTVVDVTQIGVVGGISIDTVGVVGIIAVAVVVVGLTVLWPATVCRLGHTTAELRVTRELDQPVPPWSVVELLDVFRVLAKYLRKPVVILEPWVTVLCRIFFVPERSTVVVHLIEVSSVFSDVLEGVLCSRSCVSSFADRINLGLTFGGIGSTQQQ